MRARFNEDNYEMKGQSIIEGDTVSKERILAKGGIC